MVPNYSRHRAIARFPHPVPSTNRIKLKTPPEGQCREEIPSSSVCGRDVARSRTVPHSSGGGARHEIGRSMPGAENTGEVRFTIEAAAPHILRFSLIIGDFRGRFASVFVKFMAFRAVDRPDSPIIKET